MELLKVLYPKGEEWEHQFVQGFATRWYVKKQNATEYADESES